MPQLLNPLATAEQLHFSPSRADGIPASLEEELRMFGCQTIQRAGDLLKLPQATAATAQVLLQRFYYVSSLKYFAIRDVVMGALFLACKVVETPRRVRDIINVFDFLFQRARHFAKLKPGLRSLQLERARRAQRPLDGKGGRYEGSGNSTPSSFTYKPMTYFSRTFYDAKDALAVAEMQLLKRLAFNVQVNLPYSMMINYLQLLGRAEPEDGLAQRAWSMLNDALQTPVYALFPPHVLAVASIYLASLATSASESFPVEPHPWWTLFDVSRAELRIVSAYLTRLYSEQMSDGVILADVESPPAEDALLASGLSSRVRDEHGGLIDLIDEAPLRIWLSKYSVASTVESAGPRFASSNSSDHQSVV